MDFVRVSGWIAALSLTFFLQAPLFAQEGTNQEVPPSVTEELQQLNFTLKEIQELLAQQVEQQSLDLLFKRSDLASKEVRELESLLRAAGGEKRSASEQQMRIDLQIKALARELARNENVPEEQFEDYRAQMASESERIHRRLQELEAEVAELQNKLAEKQEELEGWREILDRRLGGV